MTLAQLAAIFGVHKTTVMRWEDGGPPPERVLEIERATGVPRHELRPDIYPAPSAPTASLPEQVA